MRTTIKCQVWTSEKFIPEMTFSFSGINHGRAYSGRPIVFKRMKNKSHKITVIRHLPAEAGPAMRNGHSSQMRELSPDRIAEGVVFRVEEHLRVQQQIERRARALWLAGGCRDGAALNDWLQAEHEIVE